MVWNEKGLNMAKKPIFLLFYLVCLTVYSDGYVYKISQYGDNQQDLYFFYDFHSNAGARDLGKNPLICKSQYGAILSNAKRLNALLIAEDNLIGSLRGMEALFANPYNFDISLYPPDLEVLEKIRNSSSLNSCPTLGLTGLAYYEKIPYKNIEFRQTKSRTYLETTMKASTYLDVVAKIATDISKYNDSDLLNNFYKNVVLKPYNIAITEAKEFFDYLKKSGLSAKEAIHLAPYLDNYDDIVDLVSGKKVRHLRREDNKQKKESLFINFDGSLMNAQILHAIYASKNSKAIFIVVGAKHINDILPIIEQLGFKIRKTLGDDYTTTPEGLIRPPLPINIEQFFKI